MAEKLIDKLRADFKSRRRKVNVLGVDVWVTPLTVGESARIQAKHPTDAALRQAETLLLKCRDVEGNPVFTVDDKPYLTRDVAGDRLGVIYGAILGEAETTQEEK